MRDAIKCTARLAEQIYGKISYMRSGYVVRYSIHAFASRAVARYRQATKSLQLLLRLISFDCIANVKLQ